MYRGWTQIEYQNRSTERSEGNKTVPGKVATTCTEDGHKQTTKTGAQNIVKEWTQTDYQNKHYNIKQKDEET